jgi:hypothetical protein
VLWLLGGRGEGDGGVVLRRDFGGLCTSYFVFGIWCSLCIFSLRVLEL